MLSDIDIPRDLARAWRIALLIAVAQLAGAVTFIALGWPQSVSLMPEAPAPMIQFWFGAVFLTPIGFALGLLWQRASGTAASGPFVAFCALASIILPAVGVGLLQS